MIFGYGAAVVAGFLLTAIPNWTGRLPVAGVPLAALVGLWAAGRIAVFASAAIGRPAAAVIDSSFLIVFAALVAREVAAGRNWRNLKTAGLVFALALVNVAFHVEDARSGLAEVSTRAALGLLVMLILLIGGRVTPSFTGNWLAKAGSGPRPVPFGKPDGMVMALSGVSLARVGRRAGRRRDRRPRACRRRREPLAAFPVARSRGAAGPSGARAARRLLPRGGRAFSPSARTPSGRRRSPIPPACTSGRWARSA